jgi:protein-L-isoaspartate(D-aspartate) O-methyltransferase
MDDRTEDFRGAREQAVDRLITAGYLSSHAVIRAMKTVPREAFLPASLQTSAYVDTPLPIGHRQTISALHMVAMMAEALNLEKGQDILEIGCGSGYHAAVVAEVVAQRTEERRGHVYSIEIVPELASTARGKLRRARYEEWVTVIQGDGSVGYAEHAPYDRILVTAAAPSIPRPLIEQLKDGGFLVIPVGDRYYFQELVRLRKAGGQLVRESLGGVAFVPLRGEHGWPI